MASVKKPSSAKSADVTAPGKSAPAQNSKSVIITKHAVMQDPMVVPEAAELTPKTASSSSTQKKVIQPLTVSVPDVPEVPQPTELPVEPVTPSAPAVAVSESTPVPVASDTADKGTPNSDVEQVADAEAATKNKQHVQKMIDSKQYYLPIMSQEQRRTKRTVVIGVLLSVVLIAAWFNVALDAGIIQIDGVQPITHIFSN